MGGPWLMMLAGLLGADMAPTPVAYMVASGILNKAYIEAEHGGQVSIVMKEFRDGDHDFLDRAITCTATTAEGSVAWAKYLVYVAKTSDGVESANWPPLSADGPLNSDCDIRAKIRNGDITLTFVRAKHGVTTAEDFAFYFGRPEAITRLAQVIAAVQKQAAPQEPEE